MAESNQTDRESELLAWVTNICQTGEEIELEEGWAKIESYGTNVLEAILKGEVQESKPFGTRGYSSIYTLSYRMCSQPAAKDWSEDLYRRHGESISKYLCDVVQPALKEKHDVYLLQEFVKHWENHKVMTKWMHRLFMHLDKAYVVNGALPTLTSAGLKLFKSLIYDKFKSELMVTMLAEINKERDGEAIDRQLLVEQKHSTKTTQSIQAFFFFFLFFFPFSFFKRFSLLVHFCLLLPATTIEFQRQVTQVFETMGVTMSQTGR